MKSILVFIDGTICDASGRMHLADTPDFYERGWMLKDRAVEGSAECMNELAKRYEIVYIGARPESAHLPTAEWLEKMGYPKGDIYLAERQEDRLSIVKTIQGKHDFIAGIGDRWDDNELHAEIGCLSIILKEHEGKWETVAGRIERYHRKRKIEGNRTRLEGKVEGLARICPLLLSKYGEAMWEVFFSSVLEMAENTRDERRKEDLASFAEHKLDPTDLRHAARLDDLAREDLENNNVYGLQSYELVEATQSRYTFKVTACLYAELWQKHGRPDIGYQIHCRTDMAWWNRPAWNPNVRFVQPKTLMQGDDCCLFVQYLEQEA
jgi:hypothetical protein